MNRRSNVHLPNKNELTDILSIEAPRHLPSDKEDIHYPAFESVLKLLDEYRLSTDLFINDNLTIHQVVANGAELLDRVSDTMLKDVPGEDQVALFDACYDYLSEEDQPQCSDFIYVFGSKTLLRPLKAVELFAKRYSERIIVSGGSPIYAGKVHETEASLYRNCLVDNGVPFEAILTEEESITVPDNVRRTLNYLDESSTPLNSIILVNSPYAQRRGWAIFKKHLPDSVAVYRVNSRASEPYLKDNWYKQEDTLRVVLNEFVKMRASVVYNTA